MTDIFVVAFFVTFWGLGTGLLVVLSQIRNELHEQNRLLDWHSWMRAEEEELEKQEDWWKDEE